MKKQNTVFAFNFPLLVAGLPRRSLLARRLSPPLIM
jgi:hypothetical protein